MNKSGYYGIGIVHGKNEFNYWSLYRTAHILNANFLFIIGKRFKLHSADTSKSYKHIPVFHYTNFEDFNNHRPYNCPLIGIELSERATRLKDFRHPNRAIYLLGAEDHGLSPNQMNNCQDIIQLPGEESLNVAVAGSIVLYDRFIQMENKL